MDKRLVGGPFGQWIGKQRRRNFAFARRLAGRENRNQTARAIDQLQVGDEIPQLFHQVAIEQPLAFNDGEHIEFARRKSPSHFLVLLEFWCVGTKQLAQRIVDLEPGDAKTGGDYKEDRDKSNG